MIRMMKYLQVAKIIWTEAFIHRVRALIWTMIDVSWLFVMPLLWLSAARSDPFYSNARMVFYYFLNGIIGMLTIAYVHYDLKNDIHSGLFTNTLLKPVSQLWYRFSEHVSYKLFRVAIITPFLILFWYIFHPDTSLLRGGSLLFIIVLALGALLTFFMSYLIGLLGLFVEDSGPINAAYNLLLAFFSGEVAPIALFSPFMQGIALHLPFYFTLGFPVDVLLGNGPVTLGNGILWQLVWIAMAYVVIKIVWRMGIKRWQGHGR